MLAESALKIKPMHIVVCALPVNTSAMPTPKKPKGRKSKKRHITCGIYDKLTGYDCRKQLAEILEIPVKEKVTTAVCYQAQYSRFRTLDTFIHMPTSSAFFLCFFRFLATKDIPFIKFLVEVESSRFPLKDYMLYSWVWSCFNFLARDVKDALHFLDEITGIVPKHIEKVFRRLTIRHSILGLNAIKEPKPTSMSFEEQLKLSYRPNLTRVCSRVHDGVLCDDCMTELSLRSAQSTSKDDVWKRTPIDSVPKEKRPFKIFDDGPRMKAHVPDRIPIFTKTLKRVVKDNVLTAVEWWILRSPPSSPVQEMPSPLSDPPAQRTVSPPLSPMPPIPPSSPQEQPRGPKWLIKNILNKELPEDANNEQLREAVVNDVKDGLTLFHRFAAWGCDDQVTELLKIGIPWNLKSFNRVTALHLAARHGHLSTVKLLASVKNVDLNIRREDNWTALHLASMEGHTEIVRFLLSGGANPTVKELLGMTPLHWAAMNGRVEALHMLLRACYQRKRPWEDQQWVNPLDRFSNTPLHYASAFNHLEAVKTLLDFGADPEILNADGNRPQDEAMRKGHQETAYYLHENTLKIRKSSLQDDLSAIAGRRRGSVTGAIPRSKTTHYFFT